MSDPLVNLQDRLSRLAIPERHAGAHIRDDLRSAIGAAGHDSVSCAIQARRVVEYVVRDVYQWQTGEPSGTRPLRLVLARVVMSGYFPEELAGFVHAVKELANRVAHDTKRSYPIAYLIPALDHVLLILEWYFGQGLSSAPDRSDPTADTSTSAPPDREPAPDPAFKGLLDLNQA